MVFNLNLFYAITVFWATKKQNKRAADAEEITTKNYRGKFISALGILNIFIVDWRCLRQINLRFARENLEIDRGITQTQTKRGQPCRKQEIP
jgi:hypothetical protein